MAIVDRSEKVITVKSKKEFDFLKNQLINQKDDTKSDKFLNDIRETQNALNKAAFRI